MLNADGTPEVHLPSIQNAKVVIREGRLAGQSDREIEASMMEAVETYGRWRNLNPAQMAVMRSATRRYFLIALKDMNGAMPRKQWSN